MNINLISGGTVAYSWFTARAFVTDYIAGRQIYIRYAQGNNPLATDPWSVPVQMNSRIITLNNLLYSKVWFRFPNLNPSTTYTYEIFSFDNSGNQISVRSTVTTRNMPVISGVPNVPNLAAFHGRCVALSGSPDRYLVANDCNLYKLNQALAGALVETPIIISQENFDQMIPAFTLDDSKHILFEQVNKEYYFEFNKDIFQIIPNLTYRKAAKIEINANDQSKPVQPFNLSEQLVINIEPTTLPDIETGESALKYKKL